MDEYTNMRNFSVNRSAIILFTGMCTSLPALVWVIHHACCQSPTRRFKMVLLAPLLLNDVLQVLSSMAWLLFYGLGRMPCDGIGTLCVVVDKIWSVSRVCGLIVHVSLALEKVLYVAHPGYTNRRCFLLWATPFCLVVWITAIAIQFKGQEGLSHACVLAVHQVDMDFLIFLASLVLAGILLLLTFPSPLTPKCVREETLCVLRVVVLTLLLYCPQFVLQAMCYARLYAAGYAVDLQVSKALANLRLLTDAALCWLVCRECNGEDERQTHSNREGMCPKQFGTHIEADKEESELEYEIVA